MSLRTSFSDKEIRNMDTKEFMRRASYDDILDSSYGKTFNVMVLCRESTKQDKQIQALINQEDRMLEFVRRFPHWNIIEGGVIVEEGYSGLLVAKRPKFKEMIYMAENLDVDLIVVQEVSRFSRNVEEGTHYVELLKSYGVGLIIPNGEYFTYYMTPIEEERFITELNKNQTESLVTGVRVDKAHETIRKNKQLMGGNMFGYRLERHLDPRDNTLIAEPVEAEIVKIIFEMYVVDRLGTKKIATYLNAHGHKPFEKDTLWDASKVCRVLQKEKYMGYQMYGKFETIDRKLKKKIATHKEPVRYDEYDDNGELVKECNLVKGNWIPIIDEDTWWKAYEIRKKSSTKREGSNNKPQNRGLRLSNDAYSNKSFCQCGYTMSRQLLHKAEHNKYAQYRYKCRCQVNNGTPEHREKNNLPIPKHTCDLPAVSDVKMKLMSVKVFETVFGDVNTVIDNTIRVIEEAKSKMTSTSYGVSVEDLEKNLAKLYNRLDKFFDMRADGEMNDEQYYKKKQSTEEEIESVSKMIMDKKLEIARMKEFKLDIDQIKQRLNSFVDLSGFGVSNEMIDMFVERIICRSDNEFLWEMNLTGTIPQNYHINEYRTEHEEALKDDKNFNIIKTFTIPLSECEEFCKYKAKRQFRKNNWSNILVKIAVK